MGQLEKNKTRIKKKEQKQHLQPTSKRAAKSDLAQKPTGSKMLREMKKKEVAQATGKEKQTQQIRRTAAMKLKNLTDRVNAHLKPGNLSTYLKEDKTVNQEMVERLKKSIPVSILYKLEARKPGLILEVMFEKKGDEYTFRPGNRKQARYIGMADVLRHFLKKRTIQVNGRPAKRQGLAGAFFYENPPGYAAINTDFRVKIGKEVSEADFEQIKRKHALSKAQQQEIQGLSSAPGRKFTKNQVTYIMTAAINEGVDPVALLKALKNGAYPKGFQKLTGNEPFAVLVRWAARLMSINEKRFKALTGKKTREGKRYTRDFIQYNTTGQMPAHIRLLPGAYRRWMSSRRYSYQKPKFIDTKAINAKSPAEVQRLRRAMALHDISARKAPAETWAGAKTFENIRGYLRGKFHVPSNGIFAGSHLHSTKRIEAMRGQNVTLDLFFPGTLGYARGRYNSAMRNLGHQNRISVGVEDAFPARVHGGAKYRGRPYYSWRNLRALPEAKQKAAIATYLSNMVAALEARGLNVNELTMSGHSGGGIMLHHIAKLFPSGAIPIRTKKGARTLRIKGYFGADSHYFQNTEFFNVYYGHEFRNSLLGDNRVKKLSSQITSLTQRIKAATDETQKDYLKRKRKDLALELRDRIKQLVEEIRQRSIRALNSIPQTAKGRKAYTLRQIMDATAQQMYKVVLKKAMDGTLAKWQPPKYYGAGLRDWWNHQKRFHHLAQQLSSAVPGQITYHYKGQVTGHGQSFLGFITNALRKFEH